MMINSKPSSILLTHKGTCMHSVCLLALIKNGMEITVTLQLIKTAIRRDKSFVCWQDDFYWKSYAWEIVMWRMSTFLAETVRYYVCMRYSAVLFFFSCHEYIIAFPILYPCPDKTLGSTSIRHFLVGSMSNWCRSEVLCYLGEYSGFTTREYFTISYSLHNIHFHKFEVNLQSLTIDKS